MVVIEKFFFLGVNLSIEIYDGFFFLWFLVLYVIKYRFFLNFEVFSVFIVLEVEFVLFLVLIILNYFLKDGILDIGCSEKCFDLIFYYVVVI